MILLFDGVCNFCNQSVVFIIKRDPKAHISFASIQGGKGQHLLEQYQVDQEIDSLILIKNDTVYSKSDAVLEICRHLNKAWPLLFLLKIIPPFIRDSLYDFIARNRYKWFGKQDKCLIPSESVRKRFLD